MHARDGAVVFQELEGTGARPVAHGANVDGRRLVSDGASEDTGTWADARGL